MKEELVVITDLVALTERIETLERQNRRLKLAALGIAVGVAIVVFAGADKTPRTVEAQKIVLLDSNGRSRLTIGTPALAGATIGVNPDDPVMWLTDDKGTDRAMLTTDGLFFANGKGRPTVSLSSDLKGTSRLKSYGSDGKVSWSAPSP
jgi:hypothetical protein